MQTQKMMKEEEKVRKRKKSEKMEERKERKGNKREKVPEPEKHCEEKSVKVL